VKIPKSLPRWVPIGRAHYFVPVEQVISANLGALFPGMEILGSWAFRVTRYSDLEVKASDETEDLLTAIEEQVFQRRFTEVVRVEVQTGVPDEIRAILVDELREEQTPEFALTPEDVVDGGALLELGDLMALATLDVPELRDPPFAPVTPVRLRDTTQIGYDVPQHFKALAVELSGHERKPSHVAARPGQTVGEPCRNRVAAKDVHERYRQVELTYDGNGGTLHDEQIDPEFHKFSSEVRHALERVVAIAILDRKIAALDIADLGKPGAHGGKVWRQARRLLCGQPADPR